jgi:uncharacterized protein YkwD
MGAASVFRQSDESQPLELEVWDVVNWARRKEGVEELAWDDALAAEAHRRSARMARAGFFSHADPDRGDLVPPLDADAIHWRDCAENIILMHPGDRDPAEVAMKAWLGCPGHRKNLLNPAYTRTGVGIAASDDDRLWITQDFANRSDFSASGRR